MSKKAFDQIAAGLQDAIAIARGEAKRASYRVYVPAEVMSDASVASSSSRNRSSRPALGSRPERCATSGSRYTCSA
jgi:hypothetical protein